MPHTTGLSNAIHYLATAGTGFINGIAHLFRSRNAPDVLIVCWQCCAVGLGFSFATESERVRHILPFQPGNAVNNSIITANHVIGVATTSLIIAIIEFNVTVSLAGTQDQ